MTPKEGQEGRGMAILRGDLEAGGGTVAPTHSEALLSLVSHLRGALEAAEALAAATHVADTTPTPPRLELLPQPDTSGTIRTAAERYLAQKSTEGVIAGHRGRLEHVTGHFTDFAEARGVLNAAAIDRPLVAAWRERVMNTPFNRGNSPGAASANAQRKRSVATVNQWVTALGGFLSWLEGQGLRDDKNLIKGLHLKRAKRAHEARSAFTLEQIGTLFGPPFIRQRRAEVVPADRQ